MATVAKPANTQPIPRIAPREDLNPYRISQIQFDIAAEYLKLDQGLRQILRTPKRVLEVSIPTKMDNGQIKVFTGSACSTMWRAGRPRAAFAIIPA